MGVRRRDDVDDVRASARMTSSPATLVAGRNFRPKQRFFEAFSSLFTEFLDLKTEFFDQNGLYDKYKTALVTGPRHRTALDRFLRPGKHSTCGLVLSMAVENDLVLIRRLGPVTRAVLL